jgi:hypothetical protein
MRDQLHASVALPSVLIEGYVDAMKKQTCKHKCLKYDQRKYHEPSKILYSEIIYIYVYSDHRTVDILCYGRRLLKSLIILFDVILYIFRISII